MGVESPKQRLARRFTETLAVEEIIDDLLQAVAEELQPQDVFDEAQLKDWAEEEGYTKPE